MEKFWSEKDGAEIILPILGGAKAIVKAHGEILGWTKEIIGRSLTVSIGNVDAVFT